jgi:TetR/AcrR family transcriptional regulator
VVEQLEKDTEAKIFEAAKKIFIQKGFDGARMQDIADEAGINKSMLHYYYRSKEKLFEIVFSMYSQQHTEVLVKVLKSGLDVRQKLVALIEGHFAMLQANPDMVLFVLNEMRKNPSLINNTIKFQSFNASIDEFVAQVDSEIAEGKIKEVAAQDVLIDLISLIEYPFVAASLLNASFNNSLLDNFDQFMEQRKKHVTSVIIDLIKK